MTSMPVRLRGVGDMPEGETLYLSSLALRTLDDTECEGLLAAELAHFRPAELAFSRRFAPAQAALVNAVESVDEDPDEGAFLRLSKMPAYGLLSLMLLVLRWRMKKVNYDRETSADRAALDFAPASRLTSMMVKMTALGSQWSGFREGLTQLMNRGVGRRNIGNDYLRRIDEKLARSAPDKMSAELAGQATLHPLDAHLTLEQRAQALGEEPQVPAALIALRAAINKATDSALAAVEAEVTQTDLDYTRVPGHPIDVSDTPELPPELASTG
jgi:Zn-dependent protease with chaperone function